MRPNEIFDILYGENVFGHSIFHAVLLQEVLINIAVFMSTFPVSYKFEYSLDKLLNFSSKFFMVFSKYDLGKGKFWLIFLKYYFIKNSWMLEAMKLGLEYLKTDAEDIVVKVFLLTGVR
jgi:hypothetical protein